MHLSSFFARTLTVATAMYAAWVSVAASAQEPSQGPDPSPAEPVAERRCGNEYQNTPPPPPVVPEEPRGPVWTAQDGQNFDTLVDHIAGIVDTAARLTATPGAVNEAMSRYFLQRNTSAASLKALALEVVAALEPRPDGLAEFITPRIERLQRLAKRIGALPPSVLADLEALFG